MSDVDCSEEEDRYRDKNNGVDIEQEGGWLDIDDKHTYIYSR